MGLRQRAFQAAVGDQGHAQRAPAVRRWLAVERIGPRPPPRAAPAPAASENPIPAMALSRASQSLTRIGPIDRDQPSPPRRAEYNSWHGVVGTQISTSPATHVTMPTPDGGVAAQRNSPSRRWDRCPKPVAGAERHDRAVRSPRSPPAGRNRRERRTERADDEFFQPRHGRRRC